MLQMTGKCKLRKCKRGVLLYFAIFVNSNFLLVLTYVMYQVSYLYLS
jgi:hypothetical protein